MTGSILPAPREIGEVARVALQRLVLVLGVRVGDAGGSAHFLQSLQERIPLRAGFREQAPRFAAFLLGERDQEVLGRDVLVAELLRDLEGAVEDAGELPRGRRLRGCARHFRPPVEDSFDFPSQRRGIDAELLEDRNDDSFVALREQSEQQVLRRKLRIAARARVPLRFLNGLLGLDRELIETHVSSFRAGWEDLPRFPRSHSGSHARAER